VEFITRHKPIVTFVFCSLFCIISLSIQGGGFTLSFEGIISGVVSPFQKLYNGIHSGTSKLWAGFSELDRVREELKFTQQKLQSFEAMEENITQIKLENERLRSLLGMKEKLKYNSVPSFVIAKDPDNWYRTIVINRGKNDGIDVDMPVVGYYNGEKGVVGKIAEARGSVSKIEPVISPEIKIGVKVGEGGYAGLLSGYSHNSNLCKIDYVSRAAQIKFGDVVVTSGLAGDFPAGLVVGTVVQTEMHELNPYQRVIVKPIIDFDILEDVFVIKKSPDKGLFDTFEEVK
jgi:rod shape-determining protein MreC